MDIGIIYKAAAVASACRRWCKGMERKEERRGEEWRGVETVRERKTVCKYTELKQKKSNTAELRKTSKAMCSTTRTALATPAEEQAPLPEKRTRSRLGWSQALGPKLSPSLRLGLNQ